MRYVVLRDDDTNASTPIDCLERLYRPFLERRLPVNLATIPRVRTDTLRADGKLEGFLFGLSRGSRNTVPITENDSLVRYLHANPGFNIVQHGYHHTMNEFDSAQVTDVRGRLEQGGELLEAAGFGRPKAFVAPYDKYSRVSLREVVRRFSVFSTGWFELRRIPLQWWPLYGLKRMLRRPHWRIGRTLLLSHPGCLLSATRPCSQMLERIKKTIQQQEVTVLVTHWWEYFRGGDPDEDFIGVLHDTANWLAEEPSIRVVSFEGLRNVPFAK